MNLHFETLAPYYDSCELRVTVNTGNVSTGENAMACVNSSSTCWASSQLAVFNVIATNPTLNTSSELLMSTADKITIRGKGFDAGRITNNVFTFSSNLTEQLNNFQVTARIHENLACTSTMIVLTFDRLSIYNFGELRGLVSVSTEYVSQETEVATIQATNATIQESTEIVTTDQSNIMIKGHGFHPELIYLDATISYNASCT